MSDNSTPAAAEVDICPICAKPFKAEDICATDITEGTCHAECLEGSAVVNLDTGDEMPDGKIATYPYSDVMEPGSSSIPHPQKWTRWQGGKMPVPQGASVEVILRYGKQALAEAGSGYAARWSYDSRHGDHDDIVFYRLCTPTPQTNVGVKALEWIKSQNAADEPQWQTPNAALNYCITLKFRPGIGEQFRLFQPGGWYETRDEAVAVAQADFEARILSALSVEVAKDPPVSSLSGVELAARFVEKRRDDYVQEHGSTDPETGTVEFPGNGDEYVGELEEIIEGIRSLSATTEGSADA